MHSQRQWCELETFYIWSFCAPLSSSLSSLKKCTLHLHIDEKLSQHWMREHGSVLGDWMRTSCWQQVRIPHWSWLVAIPRCLPDTTPFEFQMHQYKRAGSRIKRVGLKKKKKKKSTFINWIWICLGACISIKAVICTLIHTNNVFWVIQI